MSDSMQPPQASPVWRKPAVDAGRRRALAGLLAATAGAVWAGRAAAQPQGACVLTPDSGEGPFYFDPRLVRADITDGRAGAPLALRMQIVREGDCATLDGARVDVWHADALGLYSGYERQRGVGGVDTRAVAGESFHRGTQITADDGSVVFHTLFPSWYRGRTPHVHFKVLLGGGEVVASQLFFPDEINDRVLRGFDPYREHESRRDTRNANDTFLDGRVGGAFCDVAERSGGFDATVVIAVRSV